MSEIAPFLEYSGSGISSLWARTIALKYDCTVIVGYPEKVDPRLRWPTGPEYYNSAIVVNDDGETVANYRKTHLYMTDEKWALENPAGFYNGVLVGLGRTAIGICMDLKYEAKHRPRHSAPANYSPALTGSKLHGMRSSSPFTSFLWMPILSSSPWPG